MALPFFEFYEKPKCAGCGDGGQKVTAKLIYTTYRWEQKTINYSYYLMYEDGRVETLSADARFTDVEAVEQAGQRGELMQFAAQAGFQELAKKFPFMQFIPGSLIPEVIDDPNSAMEV